MDKWKVISWVIPGLSTELSTGHGNKTLRNDDITVAVLDCQKNLHQIVSCFCGATEKNAPCFIMDKVFLRTSLYHAFAFRLFSHRG